MDGTSTCAQCEGAAFALVLKTCMQNLGWLTGVLSSSACAGHDAKTHCVFACR
jgi:hypothetical protein